MGSWKVELQAGGGEICEIDLIDTVGPLNDWTCLTPGALNPESGTFTNQTGSVVPTNQPSWVLNEFDIDEVGIGSTGPAEVRDSGGDFPNGNMPWYVVAQL